MRGVLPPLALALSALAAADPLGTKASPAAYDASPMGAGPVLQMLLALALVGAGVRWALPAIVKRLGGRLPTDADGTIRIEESASLPGGRLVVVEARGRTLLLGTTAGSISLLADLTAADFAEALERAEAPAHDPQAAIDRLARLERLGR